MRLLSLIALLTSPVLAVEPGASITLDPTEMEDIKQLVFGGGAVQSPQEPGAIALDDDSLWVTEQFWLGAMSEAGDVQTILLLSLLQKLNPGLPMEVYPRLYADALALHRSAAAGDAVAVANLESCLSCGKLPGGLLFIRSERLASHLRSMVEKQSFVITE